MPDEIDYTGAPDEALGFTNEMVAEYVPPAFGIEMAATSEALTAAFSTFAATDPDTPSPRPPGLIGRLINHIRRRAA